MKAVRVATILLACWSTVVWADVGACAGTHTCSQLCVNTPDSYRCECKQGFVLGSDRATCIECDNNRTGDGRCDPGDLTNTAECGFDGGDCCADTCVDEGTPFKCGSNGFQCCDPDSIHNGNDEGCARTAAVDELGDDDGAHLDASIADGIFGGAMKGVGVGSLATFGGLYGAKMATAAALPSLMSATGTIAAGTGTLHGALTATAASFAATPVGLVPVLAGGIGYGVYKGYTAYQQHGERN